MEKAVLVKRHFRIYDDLRIKALNFAKKGEYGVIDLYARIINDQKGTAIDFSTLALLLS
jgi:hypothetical protein